MDFIWESLLAIRRHNYFLLFLSISDVRIIVVYQFTPLCFISNNFATYPHIHSALNIEDSAPWVSFNKYISHDINYYYYFKIWLYHYYFIYAYLSLFPISLFRSFCQCILIIIIIIVFGFVIMILYYIVFYNNKELFMGLHIPIIHFHRLLYLTIIAGHILYLLLRFSRWTPNQRTENARKLCLIFLLFVFHLKLSRINGACNAREPHWSIAGFWGNHWATLKWYVHHRYAYILPSWIYIKLILPWSWF